MGLLRLSVTVMLLALLSGCSHQKTLSHNDLRSQMTLAVSYASEAELFVDLIRQHRTTTHYAEEHPHFLRDEIGDSLRQLTDAHASAQDEPTLRLIDGQLRALSGELGAIRSWLTDESGLAGAKLRIHYIRETLERAQADL